MEFAIGDHVIHPAHGPGEVVDYEEQELVGGYRRYCVIQFVDHGLVLRIPRRRLENVGLRQVMGRAACREVFERLASVPKALPADFKERRRLIETWISSGKPARLAEAVRDLAWRRVNKRLNQADSDLFEQARTRLLAELAIALGDSRADTETRIQNALEQGRLELQEAAD